MSVDHTAQLPEHVIGHIVSAALSPKLNNWDDLIVYRSQIVLINRHWQRAAYAERHVWSYIQIHLWSPVAFVQHCVRRVKHGALTLDVNATSSPNTTAVSTLLAFDKFIHDIIPLITHRLVNMKDLLLYTDSQRSCMDLLQALGQFAMPCLCAVKVHIHGWPATPTQHTFHMLPLAQSIQFLYLRAVVDTELAPAAHTTLTRLRLEELTLQWTALRAVLAAAVSLHKVSFRHVTASGYEGGESLSLRSVTTFELWYAQTRDAAYVALLHLPVITELHVEVIWGASLTTFSNSCKELFTVCEVIRLAVSTASGSEVSDLLPSFTAARTLDIEGSSPQVTEHVLDRISRADFRLPYLHKLMLATSLTDVRSRQIFNTIFSPDLVVITSVKTHTTMMKHAQLSLKGGVIAAREIPREFVDNQCGVELKW